MQLYCLLEFENGCYPHSDLSFLSVRNVAQLQMTKEVNGDNSCLTVLRNFCLPPTNVWQKKSKINRSLRISRFFPLRAIPSKVFLLFDIRKLKSGIISLYPFVNLKALYLWLIISSSYHIIFLSCFNISLSATSSFFSASNLSHSQIISTFFQDWLYDILSMTFLLRNTDFCF